MADLYNYRVLRQMDGDKQYYQGDEREMAESDAKHLVDLGVLEKLGKVEKKAEPTPKNKAEPAPENKQDPLDHDGDGRKGGNVLAKRK